MDPTFVRGQKSGPSGTSQVVLSPPIDLGHAAKTPRKAMAAATIPNMLTAQHDTGFRTGVNRPRARGGE